MIRKAIVTLVFSLLLGCSTSAPPKDIGFDRARDIAQAMLDKEKPKERLFALYMPGAKEYGFGWFFPVASQKYIETHDDRDKVAGGPRSIAVKRDGSAAYVHSLIIISNTVETYVSNLPKSEWERPEI